MDEHQDPDLTARVARLERLVEELMAERRAQPPAPATAAAPRPAAPRPVAPPPPNPRPFRPVRPPAPSGPPLSPTVIVAGIGAAIFLLGVAFFFYLSIQRNWIGPELRFALGLAAGAGLTALATRLVLKERRALGAAVLLAGLGTFQFSFRVGAFSYHLLPPTLGFAGAFLATLYAGALGARARSGAALVLALVSGFLAPIVFSQGGHHEVGLALYLAVLLGAALAVPYVAKAGARWNGSRWTALVGTWLLMSVACSEVQAADAGTLALLLGAVFALSFLWVWLPGVEELPTVPATLWLLVSLTATSLAWVLWKELQLGTAAFALPVLGFAALNLALVRPLRRRMGGTRADLALLVLAGGHLALAVPVALEWRWVGAVWGCFALFAAWAARRAQRREDPEAGALHWVALAMAALATLRWAARFTLDLEVPEPTAFMNLGFAEGALATGAWALLALREGASSAPAFIVFEGVAHLSFARELQRLLHAAGAGPRSASLAYTLTWAVSGLAQWVAGLRGEGPRFKALRFAGYGWIGAACAKLLLVDMDHADVAVRALAFLAVGGLFLAGALLGDRLKPKEDGDEA